MLEYTEIEKRVCSFKRDLRTLAPLQIIRKHVIHGECAVISSENYFELRSEIADKYDVHPNEVLVVGSGKLGFSIAPKKRYRHFTDTSDIDVVIVSSRLFDKIWKEVHFYWEQGAYWEQSGKFKDYLFLGWIRPDKLPAAEAFKLANDWWKFFNSISASSRYSVYKIAGALYRDWHFLESYQLRGVTACAEQLRMEEN